MTWLRRMSSALLLVVPLIWDAALADERILAFHADIDVHADGSMNVTETITVRAEGRDIKRGIYRDLPTTYKDDLGNRVVVAYTNIGVLRDARPEPHHQKGMSNGIRVYIGDKNRYLKTGEYTYTFSYRTDRQLGFFDHHDELYWNVTGNGWAFPIDQASASVRLPSTVPGAEMRLEAYTGPTGAKGKDYEASLDFESRANFRTTVPLSRKEGLTIVVGWPKGHVTAPTTERRVEWFLQDNGAFVAGGVGLLVLLFYYGLAWSRVGRDPHPGIVIPRYEPPKGYSPASMRYVRRMGYDDRTFSAALVNLAVNGRLIIDDDDGDFELEKIPGATGKLAAGESALLKKLFAAGDRLKLKQSNHKPIKSAINAHRQSLQADYEKRYFKTNAGYTILGALISIAAVAAAVLMGPSIEEIAPAAFMVVWLSIWSFGVFALGKAVYTAWKNVGGFVGTVGAVTITLFALPFFGGEIMGVWFLSEFTGIATVATLLTLVLVNWLFYDWMKAPTRLGRKLLDDVDGFGDYLSVAEEDELRFKHPPEKTPELFERFLPYALAFDMEEVWGGKFSDVIANARRDGSYRHPNWYRGSNWNSNRIGSFSSSLGSSLSGAISSSSTAPGSSSGSGGGGSSGGGGGGGGGGGW